VKIEYLGALRAAYTTLQRYTGYHAGWGRDLASAHSIHANIN